MESIQALEHYFSHTIWQVLEQLTAETPALWGQMDARRMVEHLKLSVDAGAGLETVKLATPEEKVEKVKQLFLLSDRPLQKGIKSTALPDEPLPYYYADLTEALSALKDALVNMKFSFDQMPGITRMHNVFGMLSYHEWMWFNFKHFQHHFAQFGLIPEGPLQKLG